LLPSPPECEIIAAEKGGDPIVADQRPEDDPHGPSLQPTMVDETHIQRIVPLMVS
jgi:hypothetical protein